METAKGNILVTGAAGFIGFHVCRQLMEKCPAYRVVGVDSLLPGIDMALKRARLAELARYGKAWCFRQGDVVDSLWLQQVFAEDHPVQVIHLAALPGIRSSAEHPLPCVTANVLGFVSLLEACRQQRVQHVVFASSSSVYGNQALRGAVRETDSTDSPLSLYAATKKSNEVMAYSYSSLYGLPTTGVRIFTAYGPWGRPDMAYFHFTEQWRQGKSITLFNHGQCRRDFTYVEDVARSIVDLLPCVPKGRVPNAVFNIGGSSPVGMTDFIVMLHRCLIEAGVLPSKHVLVDHVEVIGSQPGDAIATEADGTALASATVARAWVPLQEGLALFAAWYGRYWRQISED